jgi:hypothetical protein
MAIGREACSEVGTVGGDIEVGIDLASRANILFEDIALSKLVL